LIFSKTTTEFRPRGNFPPVSPFPIFPLHFSMSTTIATPVQGTPILSNIPNVNTTTTACVISSASSIDNYGNVYSGLGPSVLETSSAVITPTPLYSASTNALLTTGFTPTPNFQTVNVNPSLSLLITFNQTSEMFLFYYINPSTGSLSAITVSTTTGSSGPNTFSMNPSVGTFGEVSPVGCFDNSNNFYFFDAAFTAAGTSTPAPTFFMLSLTVTNKASPSMAISVAFTSCKILSTFTPPTAGSANASTYGYGALAYNKGFWYYCGQNNQCVQFQVNIPSSMIISLTVTNQNFLNLSSSSTGYVINYIVFDNINMVVYALINNQFIASYKMYISYSGATMGYPVSNSQQIWFNTNVPNSVYSLGLQTQTNTLFYSAFFTTFTSSVQSASPTNSGNALTFGVLFAMPLGFGSSSSAAVNSLNHLFSDICFVGNTVVETDQGGVCIRDLIPGVHTIGGGQKIVGITRTLYTDTHLVKMERDALELGVPSCETVMTMDHKVRYEGAWVMARHFVDVFRGVELVIYPKGEILFNVMLETYGCMKVHNMAVETLHPENLVARLYTTPWIAPYRDLLICELNSCIDNYDPLTHKMVRRQLRQFLDSYGRVDARRVRERARERAQNSGSGDDISPSVGSHLSLPVKKKQQKRIFA